MIFQQQYEHYLGMIEKHIEQLPLNDNEIGQSMQYSLAAGGKRVRPVLALACVELVGGCPQDFVREAVAIELIHTYSLIHDDLPAMDDDDFRRGKPSNHRKFGEATAILAGDALLTLAFEMLAQPLPINKDQQLRMIRETAEAVGWLGMVGGQVLDTLGNGQANTISYIESIHHLKTGKLLQASARMGAILGGGTEEDISRVSEYASHLGLAFQIQDDILDIVGEKTLLGKPTGSDDKLDKLTYPKILGLDGAYLHLKEKIAKAKDVIDHFGTRGYFLAALADYVGQRDH